MLKPVLINHHNRLPRLLFPVLPRASGYKCISGMVRNPMILIDSQYMYQVCIRIAGILLRASSVNLGVWTWNLRISLSAWIAREKKESKVGDIEVG